MAKSKLPENWKPVGFTKDMNTELAMEAANMRQDSANHICRLAYWVNGGFSDEILLWVRLHKPNYPMK